ncbi:PKD domain-containing protein [Aurantibacillus circumpalustris]|uniref:PKD domain-containing protein n=1 Tax=Aurantibacillus circumpalustris TaxID=3036359 RepID=UPI00295B041A|nr:PKD domain-containing protein [Aurantibacillus circumpalustris]
MEKVNIMRNFWYILILATVLFFSCRKKDFVENITAKESDFYFSGTIDGKSVSLRAGINNYYMYSSYSQTPSGLYYFTANLKPIECADCKTSLQITINDFKYSSPNEETKIDSSILPKSYPILGTPYYSVKYKSLFNQIADSYLWNFGDNKTSNEANPIHVYESAGNYSVSLKINSTNNCQQYISNIEKISYPMNSTYISSVNNGANDFSFSSSLTGSSTNNYLWTFGDGDNSTDPNPSHNYKISGTYPVLLRTISTQHDTIYAKYNIATQTNPMPCLTNYKIESITQITNPHPFSNVTINWMDENGDVFTSNNMLQSSTSNFKIISVENYDTNEKGEKTKKIKANFTCEVYNGTRVKMINNAEAILCVSYR